MVQGGVPLFANISVTRNVPGSSYPIYRCVNIVHSTCTYQYHSVSTWLKQVAREDEGSQMEVDYAEFMSSASEDDWNDTAATCSGSAAQHNQCHSASSEDDWNGDLPTSPLDLRCAAIPGLL